MMGLGDGGTKTIDALKHVRALMVRGWTKGGLAEDCQGKQVDPKDPAAVAWCIMGALLTIDGWADARRALERALPPDQIHGLVVFNTVSTTTRQDILDLCDRAIAEAAGT